jgi:two-component system, chemotaxis family, chemotaxis protein CheV
MSEHKRILLESGTNELEVLEFKIGGESYGINVMKVREVLTLQPVTALPESHELVDGMLKLRGDALMQVNLIRYLGEQMSDHDKLIITEFNQKKLAFRVSDVSNIDRMSWKEIDVVKGVNADIPVIGVVKYPDRMVMILDFESIVAFVMPGEADINFEEIEKLANARIAIADDSNFILEMVKNFLSQGGYEDIISFPDGQQALDYLLENPKSIDVLITDIEMPKMDGLTLCRQVKANEKTAHITVMLYSSLITDDIRHKGESVGADFQVNKPQFESILRHLGTMKL